ncbi:discoidin domain-containing protein [Streptomyces sp. NPDC101455]|uniref:discoidin domain-containing protein n=1 Tax=Streptomyces sp. NPDC101455 TaxID=3366142 RepID=UPI003810A9CD
MITAQEPPFTGFSAVPLDRSASRSGLDRLPQPGPDSLTNFGRDNPTRASSNAPEHLSLHVNDGSPTTYWAPLDGDNEAWVAIDLERLVTVHHVQITFPGEGRPQFCPGKSADSVEVKFPKERLHLDILLMGECTDPTGQ